MRGHLHRLLNVICPVCRYQHFIQREITLKVNQVEFIYHLNELYLHLIIKNSTNNRQTDRRAGRQRRSKKIRDKGRHMWEDRVMHKQLDLVK